MTELTGFNPVMDLNLFHPLVKDAYAATNPAHPDLLANELGGYFVAKRSWFRASMTKVIVECNEADAEAVMAEVQAIMMARSAFIFRGQKIADDAHIEDNWRRLLGWSV